MRKISLTFRKQFDTDPYFKTCARKNAQCEGRITIEHAFIYASRQIDALWNFVPLCWYHHLGAGLNKKMNECLALNRATSDDLSKYPRKNWSLISKQCL